MTTIEPGYYKEGDFGVRIESLLLCREKVCFHLVQLVPSCFLVRSTGAHAHLLILQVDDPEPKDPKDTKELRSEKAQARASPQQGRWLEWERLTQVRLSFFRYHPLPNHTHLADSSNPRPHLTTYT